MSLLTLNSAIVLPGAIVDKMLECKQSLMMYCICLNHSNHFVFQIRM